MALLSNQPFASESPSVRILSNSGLPATAELVVVLWAMASAAGATAQSLPADCANAVTTPSWTSNPYKDIQRLDVDSLIGALRSAERARGGLPASLTLPALVALSQAAIQGDSLGVEPSILYYKGGYPAKPMLDALEAKGTGVSDIALALSGIRRLDNPPEVAFVYLQACLAAWHLIGVATAPELWSGYGPISQGFWAEDAAIVLLQGMRLLGASSPEEFESLWQLLPEPLRASTAGAAWWTQDDM